MIQQHFSKVKLQENALIVEKELIMCYFIINTHIQEKNYG